jgi:hypothetical protein
MVAVTINVPELEKICVGPITLAVLLTPLAGSPKFQVIELMVSLVFNKNGIAF